MEEPELAEEPSPAPLPDSALATDLARHISKKLMGWSVPTGAWPAGSLKWTPSLVSVDPPAVMHVHISGSLPRYVVKRLTEASKEYEIYVALGIDALYDEAALRLLSDINAQVIVIKDTLSITKPAYLLAVLADQSVVVAPQMRRELALRSWRLRAEGSAFEKGRQFEALLAFLLSQVTGFRVYGRNFNGATDEIDIVIQVDALGSRCWNEPGVPFIVVEAKNWAKTVGSSVVALLIHKLETRRSRTRIGILFTTSSFSPQAEMEELKEARGNLCVAMMAATDIEAWIEAADPDEWLSRHISNAMLR